MRVQIEFGEIKNQHLLAEPIGSLELHKADATLLAREAVAGKCWNGMPLSWLDLTTSKSVITR